MKFESAPPHLISPRFNITVTLRYNIVACLRTKKAEMSDTANIDATRFPLCLPCSRLPSDVLLLVLHVRCRAVGNIESQSRFCRIRTSEE